MTKTLAAVGEEQLVRVIADLFASDALHVGIGDDAAVGQFHPNRLVVAADAMVEDVHFTRLTCPPNSVGHKLVAVNVSDFAAMGAIPLYATLTASLPPDLQFDWVCSMLTGVADTAASWNLTVAGGDVTASPGPISLSLSICGYLAGSDPILRSGAHAGDTLYVTGTLGGAALGLALLRQDPQSRSAAVQAFLEPTPRCVDGQTLAQWGGCHAMLDLSDGLATDAMRLAKASGVLLEIDLALIPRHPQLSADNATLAIIGGEDYELLFTCSEPPPVDAKAVGRVRDGAPEVRWMRDGRPVEIALPDTFNHFSRR